MCNNQDQIEELKNHMPAVGFSIIPLLENDGRQDLGDSMAVKINIDKVAKTVQFSPYISVETIKRLLDYAISHNEGNVAPFTLKWSDFNMIHEVMNETVS